jgi:hypothetical protein
MNAGIVKGVLTRENGRTFLKGLGGERYLESSYIWHGYVLHWLGKRVCGRYLPQRDYEKGEPIVLIWPDVPAVEPGYVELYYNERLVNYKISLFGHNAVNVDGAVFNFSHLINENEVTRIEDYLYRPPLGEFAPHPKTGIRNVNDKERPYYDMFGRLFMRTIHVLRIRGLDTERISRRYHHELEAIRNAPPDPKNPEKYRDFGMFTRNCTTIIRDGLRSGENPRIRGILPRDLFVNATYHFQKAKKEGALKVRQFTLKQLKVPEAPHSKMTAILNPINRIRHLRTRYAPKND